MKKFAVLIVFILMLISSVSFSARRRNPGGGLKKPGPVKIAVTDKDRDNDCPAEAPGCRRRRIPE